MTFSVVEPGQLSLDGGKRTLEVTNRFLIGTMDVTRKEWAAAGMPLPDGMPADDLPVGKVTRCQLAEFCNSLSEAEGIRPDQWSYRPNTDGEYAEGMEILDPRTHTGCRLPSPGEWDLAARAGATTWCARGQQDGASSPSTPASNGTAHARPLRRPQASTNRTTSACSTASATPPSTRPPGFDGQPRLVRDIAGMAAVGGEHTLVLSQLTVTTLTVITPDRTASLVGLCPGRTLPAVHVAR